MIRTFEELFEKMKKDGRCVSVPAGRLEVAREKISAQWGEEKSVLSMLWLTGYLFCMVDEGYISDDEHSQLRNDLFGERDEYE